MEQRKLLFFQKNECDKKKFVFLLTNGTILIQYAHRKYLKIFS